MKQLKVRKREKDWVVQKGLQIVAFFDSRQKAERFVQDSNIKKPEQLWFFEAVEKIDRIEMQDLLADGWEPYAVDNRFHYLKKEAKNNS